MKPASVRRKFGGWVIELLSLQLRDDGAGRGDRWVPMSRRVSHLKVNGRLLIIINCVAEEKSPGTGWENKRFFLGAAVGKGPRRWRIDG